MIHPDFRFWRAVATMVGGIVGVGVFGLPFAFAHFGAAPSLLMLAGLAVLLIVLQLMVGELAIRIDGNERVVGYVRRFLGPRFGKLALVLMTFGLWGALLAYLIVGGNFLHALIGPVFGASEAVSVLLLAAVGGFLVYRGLSFVSHIEIIIVCVILFLFVFIAGAAVPHAKIAHLVTADPSYALTTYGVMLFALAGLGVVPEMQGVLAARAKRQLRHAIVVGMGIIVALYALFSLAVSSATGLATTAVAFDGLVPLLGDVFRVTAALIGTVTILSVFTIVGTELMNTFTFDSGIPWRIAWALALGVPVIAYLFGMTNFIALVGFVGGVFSAGVGILVVLAYERLRRDPLCKDRHCLNVPRVVSYLLIAIFLVGAILEIASQF